uniref:Uncharacterized protein n=1 Tax=Meloidogyne enterolobii TaxID=390850 RepID=A0A6V7W0N0_MELEN|nr:unnamed protein product [Meloidogyne enterolobii]
MASVDIFAATEATNTSRAREIGIGLCYEPRPSARRLPARRVPQNPARSAGFCTSLRRPQIRYGGHKYVQSKGEP